MKEYKKETIQNIIDSVNKTVFLPDIQRPFVWDQDQICKLFDSLMRDYPISTLLFWELTKEQLAKIEKNDKTKINIFRFVEANSQESVEELKRDRDNYSLVLDGQQRLTSFYIALKGYWDDTYRNKTTTKEFYFNALSGVKENENQELYEFEFKDKQLGICGIERELPENLKVEKVWLNVKNIFESELGESRKRKAFVRQILDENNLPPELFDPIEDNIDKFDDVLKKNGVINYFPEKEDDYERVLDIFVRTNSGGTRLGYSDLLFSKIKLNWGLAREKFKEVLKKIRVSNFEFNNDFLLKICLAIYAKNNQEIRYNISNLHTEFFNSVKSDWDQKISLSIYAMIDLLKMFFLTDKKLLPSYNALIPVIYWLFKTNRRSYKSDVDNDLKEKSEIRKWLIKALLSGTFSGQSDTVLFKAKEAIDESKSSIFPGKEIQEKIETLKNRRMDLDTERIEKISYNSKDSHLFLALCYNNSINFQPISVGNFPEQDHIFCKKELIDAGVEDGKINSIFNIRFVSLSDNRSKSDIPFVEWVKSLKNKDIVFETHLIPSKKSYSVKNFDEFIQDRKELILKTIR